MRWYGTRCTILLGLSLQALAFVFLVLSCRMGRQVGFGPADILGARGGTDGSAAADGNSSGGASGIGGIGGFGSIGGIGGISGGGDGVGCGGGGDSLRVECGDGDQVGVCGAGMAAGELLCWWLLPGALVLFGLGEGFAMTPVMEDMIDTVRELNARRGGGDDLAIKCGASSNYETVGEAADETADEVGAARGSGIHGIGGLVTAAFALGQMIGPLLGTSLTAALGFEAASAIMAVLLMLLIPVIFGVSGPRARRPLKR